MIEPQHGSADRQMFATLIDSMKYKVAVEVGVRYGWFSKFLLDNSSLDLLYAIDPWDWNAENPDPFGSYSIAKRNLDAFGVRVNRIQAKNEDVLHLFDAESVDFVYLDGLHDYESVKRDISNWWVRLRNRGCLAGHDYCSDEWPGLVQAVNEHVEANGLQLFLTGVGDEYGESDYNKKSWYVFK